MSSPPILDISRLLEPISAEQPAGIDLREDSSPRSTYYAVRDARNQARTAERQAQMNGESPMTAGDWSAILSNVPQILATSSKDLEFAAYLTEALVRSYGFAGLRDGFQLMTGLVENFSDQLYPLPDEDGLETRLAPFTGLNGSEGDGTLISPIRNISLTERTVGEYSTASYEQAIDVERANPETKERRLAQGAVSLSTIQSAVAQSRTEFLVQLQEDINESLTAYSKLEAAFDEKYGRDAPPTSNIRTALQTCRDVLQTLAHDRLAAATSPAIADSQDSVAAPAVPSVGPGAVTAFGPIQSRDDAFKQLQQIAAYFRRTEPHTPITFAIEQVVRWGRMPLPELLRELIPEPTSVQQMFRLVGIPQDQNQ